MSSFLFTHILAHWTVLETVPSPRADPRVNQLSTWQASLWVTGDADAHFRETSWSDTALLAKQCGQGCAPHLLNKTATETTMSRDQVYMTSQPPQHGASYYTLSCIFSLRAERKVKESSLIHNSPTNHETIYVTQSFVFVLTFCII